jgi:phosphatidylinositol glycan class V
MTSRWRPWTSPQDHSFLTLTICFVFWKALLIGIALTSPGPGYDTSTTLLKHEIEEPHLDLQAHGGLSESLSKFVRWDAIYFTQISLRGYMFEQEWAFGWGFVKLLAFLMLGIAPLQRTTASTFVLIGKVWKEQGSVHPKTRQP